MQTEEMYKAEQRQNEAWAKVTELYRMAKKEIDQVTETRSKQPTEKSLFRWIISTNGLYNKASEAYDNAVAMDNAWVKACNQAKECK